MPPGAVVSPLRRALLAGVLCLAVAAAAQADEAIDTPSSLSAWPQRLPVAQAEAWTVSARLGWSEGSDALPLRAMEGDWSRYQPRPGNQVAAQFAQAEVSAARSGWEFAIHRRSELLLTGSRGAFDLVHAYKRRAQPAPGTAFSARVVAQGAKTTGVRVARTWGAGPRQRMRGDHEDAGWRWTLAATALSVHRSLAADLRGSASYGPGGPEAFEGTATRHDSSKQFGGFGNAGATGQGLSVDAGLSWGRIDGLRLNLSLVDVWSHLELAEVAAQSLRLASATLAYDADGYLVYRPALNGQNRSASLRTQLLRKSSLVADWPLNLPVLGEVRMGARWTRVGTLDMPALTLGRPLASGWVGMLELDPRFHAVGVGFASRSGALMLHTGGGVGARSHFRGVQVSWATALR